jgi:hypothetical protein
MYLSFPYFFFLSFYFSFFLSFSFFFSFYISIYLSFFLSFYYFTFLFHLTCVCVSLEGDPAHNTPTLFYTKPEGGDRAQLRNVTLYKKIMSMNNVQKIDSCTKTDTSTPLTGAFTSRAWISRTPHC